MKDFTQFKLSSPIQEAIRDMGWTTPRPIQAETINAVLNGEDVLGLAQTGTGKTAAFALPIIEGLLATPCQASRTLVIAPTRELAMQIETEFKALAKFTKLKTVTIYGGVSMNVQKDRLRKFPEIIVACPGRLLDLMGQNAINLDSIDTLVLDEADRLFDMGFLPDIRKIVAAIPKKRRNLLWSATMPREIRKLAHDILVDPHVVELAKSTPADTISHALYPVARERKLPLLTYLMNKEAITSGIIFTRTKHRARKLAEQLSRRGRRAIALQGNMSQAQRDHAMEGFRKGQYDILVATDIASRGIDVAQVSHVVNFDMPDSPDAYTHRIGRTGRAEREGKAYTFMTTEDKAMVNDIEKKIGSKIDRNTLPEFDTASPKDLGLPTPRTFQKNTPWNKNKRFGKKKGSQPAEGGNPWHRKRKARALRSR
ncbi:MAG: DEAD/DEAH box helicase [Planctomycetota bacterium]|nr:DEAD/DEAH box helicase [Planctomycetota bacterium]